MIDNGSLGEAWLIDYWCPQKTAKGVSYVAVQHLLRTRRQDELCQSLFFKNRQVRVWAKQCG